MRFSFPDYRLIDKICLFLKLDFLLKLKSSFKNAYSRRKYASQKFRSLEIGPGISRLEGFETLNVIDGRGIDYVMDVSEGLNFDDNTFDLIYASHIIEHVPWFRQNDLFKELFRVLKPGGVVEIWVPDVKKLVDVFISYEEQGENFTSKDGWYRFNPQKDVMTWFNGRLFSYGDGTCNVNSFNWHKCVFSYNSLAKLMQNNHFVNVRKMDNSQVRGYNHGWINLGVRGEKCSM